MKNKISVNDFFSKCGQIRSFMQICLHLLKKFLMEKLVLPAVPITDIAREVKCFSLEYHRILALFNNILRFPITRKLVL